MTEKKRQQIKQLLRKYVAIKDEVVAQQAQRGQQGSRSGGHRR